MGSAGSAGSSVLTSPPPCRAAPLRAGPRPQMPDGGRPGHRAADSTRPGVSSAIHHPSSDAGSPSPPHEGTACGVPTKSHCWRFPDTRKGRPCAEKGPKPPDSGSQGPGEGQSLATCHSFLQSAGCEPQRRPQDRDEQERNPISVRGGAKSPSVSWDARSPPHPVHRETRLSLQEHPESRH